MHNALYWPPLTGTAGTAAPAIACDRGTRCLDTTGVDGQLAWTRDVAFATMTADLLPPAWGAGAGVDVRPTEKALIATACERREMTGVSGQPASPRDVSFATMVADSQAAAPSTVAAPVVVDALAGARSWLSTMGRSTMALDAGAGVPAAMMTSGTALLA